MKAKKDEGEKKKDEGEERRKVEGVSLWKMSAELRSEETKVVS